MALISYSNLEEKTFSSGTGNLVLEGPGRGGQGLYTRCADGDTFRYIISGVDSSGKPDGEWEQGLGTWRTGNIVERTSIDSSSNSDLVVNFSNGTKYLKVLLSVNDGLTTAEVASIQALVSADGNLAYAAVASTTGTPGEVRKLSDGPNKGVALTWAIPEGSSTYAWCWQIYPLAAYL